MKEKYEIVEKSICGINNPQLVLKIKTDINNIKLNLLVDSKEKDFELSQLDKNLFLITAKLENSDKKIEVYAEDKILVSLKNALIKRVFNKIFGSMRKILFKIKVVFIVILKGIRFLWREHHFLVPPTLWGKYFNEFVSRVCGYNSEIYNPFIVKEYNKWLKNNNEKVDYEELKYNPKFSILIPVYNIKREYLSDCLDSILAQKYENFEVCLVDDCSTLDEVRDVLEKYKKKDSRIKVKYRNKNGHISRTTNDALEMADGEFIALVDDDDIITPDALYQVAKVLNEHKDMDFIYSDEDKLDMHGNFCEPHFKPDFSPDTLLGLNYICHFSVIRRKLVNEVGGLEVGLEGAQDHDLFLKVTEKTDKIYHIPKILYHWRKVEGSTSASADNKDYAADKGILVVEKALKRRGLNAKVVRDDVSLLYEVRYLYDKEPSISIIIPTRDYVKILKKCVDSIYEKTNYKNFEVIIANNDSKEEETLKFFEEYKKKYDNFKVVDCIMDFNYSKINNIAVSKAKGDYVVLLNNDTEVITKDWLSIMVGYAMQDHIGTVGVKLLYPDYTVQHGGVILGIGGIARHAYLEVDRNDVGMYGRLRVPYNYSANTAACMMIKKSKFLEVGGLEEQLKVAFNDVDFNLKVLKKGYYNVFLPQVELIHHESKSRGLDTTTEKYKRFKKECEYMYDKWDEDLLNDRFYNPNFSKKSCFMLDKFDKD